MKCPNCKEEMFIYDIPFAKNFEAVYHRCENKNCVWYGIRRTEIKVEE